MQGFSKDERLSRKKVINQLFANGNSFVIHPFRVWWLHPSEEVNRESVQVLISVSKRHIRKAVTRNLIKRRIREAYRKNKSLLLEGLSDSNYAVAFVYVDKKPLEYNEIEKKIILVLQRLPLENEKYFG